VPFRKLQPTRSPYTSPCQRNYNFHIVAMLPRMSIHVKGTTGLVIAAVIMIAVLIAFPAYRLFLAISVAIGVVFALIFPWRN
jgi:hypothetical protein